MKKLLGTIWKGRLDFAGLLGFACVLRGAALVYRPAAWIAGGCAVLAYAVFASYRDLRNRKGP